MLGRQKEVALCVMASRPSVNLSLVGKRRRAGEKDGSSLAQESFVPALLRLQFSIKTRRRRRKRRRRKKPQCLWGRSIRRPPVTKMALVILLSFSLYLHTLLWSGGSHIVHKGANDLSAEPKGVDDVTPRKLERNVSAIGYREMLPLACVAPSFGDSLETSLWSV